MSWPRPHRRPGSSARLIRLTDGHLPLTAFDFAVLLVVGLSVLVSLVRGASREALAMACWLGAGAIAWYGFGHARELAQKTIETAWLADLAAFCVVFIVPLIGFKVVAAILADHLPGGGLGDVDRAAGPGVRRRARGGDRVRRLSRPVARDRAGRAARLGPRSLRPALRAEGAGLLQRLLPEQVAERSKVAAGSASAAPASSLAERAKELAGQ